MEFERFDLVRWGDAIKTGAQRLCQQTQVLPNTNALHSMQTRTWNKTRNGTRSSSIILTIMYNMKINSIASQMAALFRVFGSELSENEEACPG